MSRRPALKTSVPWQPNVESPYLSLTVADLKILLRNKAPSSRNFANESIQATPPQHQDEAR